MKYGPITFAPLFMERVWGGHCLREMFGKALPDGVPIGESWELVDRPEAQSVVAHGPLQGLTLHGLWTSQRGEIFGPASEADPSPRFPLLIKLLDARERLSVQVHPPADIAPALGGEPKTEVWYFAASDPGAVIYAGLRSGVTRTSFEAALRDGSVEQTLHTIPVSTGDSIFIPSGRIHAIGSGNVIIEIQQNSDTTYRVFDWNRAGLDGKPRDLHIEESLACTDFNDIEPSIDRVPAGVIASCPHFTVEKLPLDQPLHHHEGTFALYSVAAGAVACGGIQFPAGSFFLIPASMPAPVVTPSASPTLVLRITAPVS